MSTSRHFPSNQIFLCRPWKFETGIERGEIMGCAVGEISIPEKKKTSSERDQKLYPKDFFAKVCHNTGSIYLFIFKVASCHFKKLDTGVMPSTRK